MLSKGWECKLFLNLLVYNLYNYKSVKKNPGDNLSSCNQLISSFNSRTDSASFGEMYSLLYKQLYYYAAKLFEGTGVEAEDVIHDVFLKVWEKKNVQFENIKAVKSYMYISIKNNFLSYARHNSLHNEKMPEILMNEDYYTIQAAEAEVYSAIAECAKLLPSDCVNTFKMLMEGYSVKEIATMLEKPAPTIYSQKAKAITILSKRLNKEKIFVMIYLVMLS